MPVIPAPLLAHEGLPLAPHDLPGAWSLEPGVVAALLATAALYARGAARLGRQAREAPARRVERAAFWAGWAALAAALVSPLHALGGVLFSAHMAQHQLLMVVAAPLLVIGRPLVPLLWALPPAARRAAGRMGRARPLRAAWTLLTRPDVAWALQAAAILLWHVPAAYGRGVESEAVHALQHATFLGAALLFWWSLLHGHHARLRYGAAVVALFTTALYSSGVGALLAVAPRPLYPVYATTTGPWGLTPLEDQQLAGLVMWVPAGLSYLAAALALGARWLAESERRVLRWEAARGGRAAVLLAACLAAGGLTACDRGAALTAEEAGRLTGGSAERGKVAVRAYGCGSCHTVPGVPGASSLVGPPLAGVGGRSFVAGVLPNTPENLARWIRDPQGVDPLTAMPDVGVSEADARDIAAYLYTLR